MIIPFLIALSLNFDTFSVSVVEGAQTRKHTIAKSLRVAIIFGFVQGALALIGALLGLGFKKIIADTDHWVAFILLLVIGLKMIRESFGREKCESRLKRVSIKSILLLAVATSIDSLIVGVTIAFLKDSIFMYAGIIGLVTLMVSFAGYHCGGGLKKICGSKAPVIGGLILIIIGIKTLIQHLYFGG